MATSPLEHDVDPGHGDRAALAYQTVGERPDHQAEATNAGHKRGDDAGLQCASCLQPFPLVSGTRNQNYDI